VDRSLVLIDDDVVSYGQALSRSLTDLFRREKGIEDFADDFLGDAHAVVFNQYYGMVVFLEGLDAN